MIPHVVQSQAILITVALTVALPPTPIVALLMALSPLTPYVVATPPYGAVQTAVLILVTLMALAVPTTTPLPLALPAVSQFGLSL